MANRHYKMGVACINLGGSRTRIRYVYQWNMCNMPADLIVCCEVDVVIYEQMTQEFSEMEASSPRTWRPAPAARVQ